MKRFLAALTAAVFFLLASCTVIDTDTPDSSFADTSVQIEDPSSGTLSQDSSDPLGSSPSSALIISESVSSDVSSLPPSSGTHSDVSSGSPVSSGIASISDVSSVLSGADSLVTSGDTPVPGGFGVIDKNAILTPEGRFWRGKLPTLAERSAYDALAAATENYEKKVDFSTPVSYEASERVMQYFLLDHPEVFWWESAYTYYVNADGLVTSFEMSFIWEGEELMSRVAEVEAAVSGIIASLDDNATDFEAALYFHDLIVTRAAYTEEEDYVGDCSRNVFSIYGALIDGQCVCEGYSEAFQYLCEKVGIPCFGVIGTAVDRNENTLRHKWNCVFLGSDWYLTDVTWDDPERADGYYYISRKYFCKNDEKFSADHTADEGLAAFMPQCGAVDADYYEYFGLICGLENLDGVFVNAVLLALSELPGEVDRFTVAFCAVDADAAADCFAALTDGNGDRIRALLSGVNVEHGVDLTYAAYYPADGTLLRICLKSEKTKGVIT